MITRYAADEQLHHDDRGPWVLYAEHLVAVEALIAENAAETAQHVKPIYVDAWDGMAVPYGDHVVAVEAAHAAGMREALADFLTSIDDDDPVYLRGRADALTEAREAVVSRHALLSREDRYDNAGGFTDALTAIDALKTSLPDKAYSYPLTPVPPTSVAPAGEEHGAPVADLTPWDMRVLVEMLQSARALVESEDFDGFTLGRATGRAEARDAVAAHAADSRCCDGYEMTADHALAAIDALWGES